MAIKQSTANWVPIRLVDASDSPVTGLAFNAAAITGTFKLCKNGVAAATWNPPNSGAWIEDGNGYYRALLAAGDCDTLGLLTLIAVTTTGQPWEWQDRVEAQLPSDNFSRLGAPAGASVSADIAAIQAKTVNLPASPAAVGSNMGTVASVTGSVGGDVQGKVLGGGASSITGTGARAVDGSGNAIAPAATALSTAQWTNARAANLDNLNASVSSLATLLARVLGLTFDNTREDQHAYGTGANSGPTDLCSMRLRAWDSAANANANGATGLIASYDFTWSYSAPGVVSEQKVIRTL